ncbi:MAG: DnaD domain protein [Ruminococcus sp.]|nr:DnaD domain protein [Ruminococcus sp.]
MKCGINWDEGVFAVPDKVTEGLKLASGKSLKLLIYYLKYREFPDDPAVIGAGADDIEDAVNYWQQVGVFRKMTLETAGAVSEDSGESVPASGGQPGQKGHSGQPEQAGQTGRTGQAGQAEMTGRTEQTVQTGQAGEFMGNLLDGVPGVSEKKTEAKVTPPSGKSYLPEEIAKRIEESGEVAFMFSTAETEFKRPLKFGEQQTLLWLHDFLGMSADVVMMIAAYCCRRWGASIKRIEDTAVDMYERDIVTHENVNRELAAMERRCSYEGRLKAKLGIQSMLSPRQRELAEEWCSKGISVELAAKAYYISMENKGKADFRYMAGILKKWYDAGITDPEAAESFDDRDKFAAPRKKSDVPKRPPKRDKSNGNDSPSYDLAAILAED